MMHCMYGALWKLRLRRGPSILWRAPPWRPTTHPPPPTHPPTRRLQTDRKTPLGELNWIFTAITDTIAWNVLPRALFQKLFRQVGQLGC